MRSAELFPLPGLEPPRELAERLGQAPRSLQVLGKGFDFSWRTLLLAATLTAYAYAAYVLLMDYFEFNQWMSLFLVLALAPLVLIYLPYHLIHTFKLDSLRFRRAERLYKHGKIAIGQVNMLSILNGNEHDNYYLARERQLFQSIRVRVDYTFPLEQDVFVGTVFLKERSAKYLNLNDDICVLYLEENPKENMLFPIPSQELQSALH